MTRRIRLFPVLIGLAIALLAALGWVASQIRPPAPALALACEQAAPDPAASPAGRTFHVDPVHGRDDGDGSAARPWASLQAVIDAGQLAREDRRASPAGRMVARLLDRPSPFGPQPRPRALVGDGDTVLLHDGNHGAIDLGGLVNRRTLTIAAAPGARPHLTALNLDSASHFAIRGLTIIGPARNGDLAKQFVLSARALPGSLPADHLVFAGLTMGSATRFATASPQARAATGRNGAMLTGDCLRIERSLIHDVRIGVSLYRASRAALVDNEIADFSIDGIDYQGDDITIAGNLIRDQWLEASKFHPDCMQGQSPEPGRWNRRISIERNLCLYQSRPRPHPGPGLMGINIFDGRWRDVLVRCNLLLLDARHGIALYGVDSAQITNNVVLGGVSDGDGDRPAWVLAFPAKDGRPPSGNVVVGNVAGAFPNAAHGGPQPAITVVNSVWTGDPAIIGPLVHGFGGVTLGRNTLLRGPRPPWQSPDPRLTPARPAGPIAPMDSAALRARFALPAACNA